MKAVKFAFSIREAEGFQIGFDDDSGLQSGSVIPDS
jgi:hypothetical protein